MDLVKLAEALGLPKDTPAEKIYAAAAGLLTEGKGAKDTLSSVAEQLSSHGFKVEAGKVVKLAVTPPPADETPREKDLRSKLEVLECEGIKSKLSFAKAETERLVKEGVVPAALSAKLEKLFSLAGGSESLSLSSAGAPVKQALDVIGTVREILNSLPSINSVRLSQLSAADTDEAKKKSEELSAKAKEVSGRVQGIKPVPVK